MHTTKHDVMVTFIVGFFIVLTILGGIGAAAFTAHENNVKSRRIAEECVRNGGNFQQEQGEMSCNGVRK